MFFQKNMYYFYVFLLCIAFNQTIYSQALNTPEENTKLDQRIDLNLSDESLETQKLMGKDSSVALYKVLLDRFEDFSNWNLVLSNDISYGRLSKRIGLPNALRNNRNENLNNDVMLNTSEGMKIRLDNSYYKQTPSSKIGNGKKYVLGANVTFRKRGHTDIILKLNRPIHINGLVKKLEVWVSGRQRPFQLYSIVEDAYGDTKYIPMGSLDFLGWQRLSATVPNTITHYDYLLSSKKGLKFKGFLIRCHPLYTKGTYYIYFDELSAEISRFFEESKIIGDPTDQWK